MILWQYTYVHIILVFSYAHDSKYADYQQKISSGTCFGMSPNFGHNFVCLSIWNIPQLVSEIGALIMSRALKNVPTLEFCKTKIIITFSRSLTIRLYVPISNFIRDKVQCKRFMHCWDPRAYHPKIKWLNDNHFKIPSLLYFPSISWKFIHHSHHIDME